MTTTEQPNARGPSLVGVLFRLAGGEMGEGHGLYCDGCCELHVVLSVLAGAA